MKKGKIIVKSAFLVALVLVMAFQTVGAQQKVQLRFHHWMWDEFPFNQYFAELVAEYEAMYPNVEVVKINTPYGQFFDKMYTEISAGNPADLYPPTLPHPVQLINMDALEPLNKWMDEDFIKVFSPVIHGPACSKNGQIYAVPGMTVGGTALFYNKDMLDEAGVGVPTTPEEFFAAAKKMTKAGRWGTAFNSANTGLLYQHVQAVIIGFGSDIANNGELKLTDPKTIEAIKWYKSLFDAGVTPLGIDSMQGRELFWQGRVGMIIEGPWGISQIKEHNPTFEWGTAPNPWQNGDSWVLVGTYLIPKRAKNKQEAWNFIKLACSKKWQERYLELTGIPTGRNDLTDSKVVAREPRIQAFLELLNQDELRLRLVDGYPLDTVRIYKMLEDEMIRILFDNKPVEKAMADLQKNIERTLKK